MRTYNENEQLETLAQRFEEMLRENQVQFLEMSTFEQIISYYQKHENLHFAIKVTEHAIEQYSYSSVFYLKKAQLLFDMKQMHKALVLLEKAEVYDPSELDIHLLKAEIYSHQEKFDEAKKVIQYAISIAPLDELDNIHLRRAKIFEDMDRYDLSFYALRDCLLANPKNLVGLEKIYLAIEISEKYEESISLHQQIVDENPYSCLGWYNLGHAYKSLKEYEKAIEAFEFVMVIDDKFEFAYIDCSDVFYSCGLYEKALELHDEYIEFFNPDAEIFTKSGMCHEQLGDLNKAKQLYLAAIEIDPDNDLPHYRLGECYAKEGLWVSALHSYLKASELNECSSDYFTALGIAYFQEGNIELANDMFSKACDLAPDECDKWIQYAIFLQEIELPNSALDILEEAFMYCNSKCLHYCKAACLFGLGRRKEGFEILKEALTYDQGQSNILFEFLPTLKDDSEIAMTVESFRE